MTLPAVAPIALIGAVALTVLLLYLLKPSPRRLIVSSTLIWRRVLRARNRAPDRMRWWISLLLAMFIALGVASALTRPALDALGATAERVVLVLDNSATLATLMSDGQTRWEHAQARAREIIASGGPDSRYLVADTQHSIASPRFEEPVAALQTLAGLRVMPWADPLFPDVLAIREPNLRAWFITDGVAPIQIPPGVETRSVFQIADNVGITAFDVRAVPGDARRHQAFVQVLNASPGAKRVELQVAGVGRSPMIRTLDIAAGTVAGETFDVSTFGGGPLRALVTAPRDALAADDIAFAYLPASRAIRVGLVSAGDAALERTLRLLPRAQLLLIPPQRVNARSGVDVWVFDRYAPAQPPLAPALLFRPPRAQWLPASHGDVGATSVASWVRGHPITDGLSLRDVLAEHALAIQAESPAQVLAADANRRPLILASPSGLRWVEVAFALQDSNLPAQAGFPVFLSNVVDWMTGEPLALKSQPGEVRLPIAGATVVDLQGHAMSTRDALGATLVALDDPGLYAARAGERRLRVAVSVSDPSVTAVNASRLADQPAAPALQARRSNFAPWRALLLAAALLLVLEWWSYNRRLTV